jgi:hypothetical protein
MGVGVGLGVWVIVEGYSPVPFADFWGQFPFLERAVAGNLRIGDFWAQTNEHRIFIPRIEFLLDYRFFGGTNVFLFSMIAASGLLLAAALAAVVWRETGDRLLTWGAFCVSAIAAVSPVTIENLTWAYQVQFVQVFLLAAIAIITVVLAARGTEPRRRQLWTAAAALAGIAATYSLANGLLVWPVVLLLAIALGLSLRSSAFLAVVGAITIFSYLWHLEFATHGNLSHPLGIVEYVAVYLGSVLRQTGTTGSGAVGSVGIALFALLCVIAWKRRLTGSISVPVGAGLALFLVLSALQTAAGRLDFGVAQALSSRYATASFAFWLGLLLGFLTPALERVRRPAWIGSSYFGVAAVLALVIGGADLPGGDSLRSIVVGKKLTVLAFLAGIDDPGGTTTGGASGPVVSNAFRWMRERNLGPWAPGGMVDGMRFTPPPVEGAPSCRGRLESAARLSGGVRLRGWLEPPGQERASTNLAVLDSRGAPRGLGLVGTYRPELMAVGAARSKWTGFVAYARGDVRQPRIVLVGSDHRTPVCRL